MKRRHLSTIAILMISAGVTTNAMAVYTMENIYQPQTSTDASNLYSIAQGQYLVRSGYYNKTIGGGGYSSGLLGENYVDNGGTQLGASSNSGANSSSSSGTSSGQSSTGIGSMTAANVTNNYIDVLNSPGAIINNGVKQGAGGSSQSNSLLNTQSN